LPCGNHIFLHAFLKKTCYKLMHGQAPRVSHFSDCGCVYFILKKGKLDKFEVSVDVKIGHHLRAQQT
jgi:hypothetical protein